MQLTRKIETPEPDGDDNRAFRLVSPDAGRVKLADNWYGDNAEIKKMAQETAAEQRREIAELQAWLDKNGGRAPKR